MRPCPECGAENEERALFCLRCGNALAAPLPRVHPAPDRRVQQTEHFELHFPARSFAELRIEAIAAQLERLVLALSQLLALPGGMPPGPRSRVYLGDTLPGQPGGEGASDGQMAAGSWVIPERGELWCVFRPDSPGLELDRGAIRLIILRALGADIASLPSFWAGLSALCAQMLGQLPPPPEIDRLLLARGEGNRPPPPGAWDAPLPPQGDAALPSLSFLAFLLARAGPTALRDFIVAATRTTPDQAARAVYRSSLDNLRRAWWKAVRGRGASAAGGLGRFLRSSAHYLRPYWLQEGAILALIGLQLAFQQFLPKAQELLIDRAIVPRDVTFLAYLSVALFGLVVLVLVAGVANGLLSNRVSESVMRTLRERMFERLQTATHRFYSRIESGDILSRFSGDLRAVEQGLTSTLTQGLVLGFSLVLSSIHILLINWQLGALVLLSLPLFLVTTRFLGPPAYRASLAYSQEQAAVTGIVQEDLAAQPVVKAYNLQSLMIERFRVQAGLLFRAAVRSFFLGSLFGVTANLLTTMVTVMVLAVGGYFVIQARISLGSLIEFLSLLGLVIGPVQSVSGLLQSIQTATASLDRVEQVLNLEPDVQDAPDAVELGPLRGSIRFEDVSFSYRGDQPQLDRISLEIPAGKSIAFVGPSGSGKSTAINLLLRFYDPDRGRILFDGQDLRQASLESLRRQLGTVFQESFLFNTTIRENIRYGRTEATGEELQGAARESEIHEAIMEMPRGYDTVVGERGSSLSGGQRQRLAIARAILRRPSVLVLDEATSALDPRTENAVSQTLQRLAAGKTTVTVTHRLAAVAGADRIFVLDRGRLVEQGTHEELIEANGLYRRLYEEQSGTQPGAQRALQIGYLQSVPLLAGLGPEILAHLADFLRSERVAEGEVVVQAGDEADRFYLIVSGELDVLAPGSETQERVLARLGSGEYFGEIALLRDVRRTATVRARAPSQLLSLDKQTLQGLFRLIPDLRSRLEAEVESRVAANAAAAPSGGS